MRLLAACAAALALGAGCAGGDEPDPGQPSESAGRSATEREGPATDRKRPPRRARLEPASCPSDLTNCATADGRIVYVERVDPDGDGDAHFVLSSDEAITLPGISVIDVRKSLRPRPLPDVGDRISAAGPVYRGSFGQKQIEAIELHVARRRG